MREWVFWTILGLLLASLPVSAGGEIYGTITTTGGDTLTGPIRWDKNENFWDDVLDATKRERIQKKEDEKGFRFSVFGITVGGGDNYITHAFSIPFGHLRSIEPRGGRLALLTLKNGEEIEVSAGSTDIGHGMRALEIEDTAKGRVELSWGSIERVELRQSPNDARDAERLYGTVVSAGGTFVGTIIWDRDESLTRDILDGNDGEDDREVPFASIRAIEPQRRGGSRVTLTDGETIVLGGTNDVDRGHRGVEVSVRGLGHVEISWDDVEEVTFSEPPTSPAYAEFDGGRPIRGTVHKTHGGTVSGRIVWDRDEQFSWETLDGRSDGNDFSIPFANIRAIEPRREQGSKIHLADDRVLELFGTNDVNDQNKGLIVTSRDGSRTELSWDEVERVEFD